MKRSRGFMGYVVVIATFLIIALLLNGGLGNDDNLRIEYPKLLELIQENRVEQVSPRELYPLLLQQTYTPDDPNAMVKTLALVERLSRSVKLLKLYCNLDPQAADAALEGLDK